MLQNLGKDADVAGRKMQGLNQTSKGMGGGFKFAAAGAAAVGTGLLAAAGAAVGYGLKVAAGNEQAKIGFTTMLGSGKKAEAFLKQLEAFAAKTPFEFPELQKAASSLISVGINANSVIPIMKTLGNVTSGMGTGAEGVQRATVALQQMQSAGRITAEDLNQLRDAGIPLKTVMAAISAETGTSSEKLFEMSRNGKLGKKELDGLMASLESGKGFEKFNGLMDAQSKSLTGMLSTLKDTFGMGLAKAIEPALPFLKGAIGAVTKSLGDLFGWINTHQEDVVIGIVDTGNAVLGLAKTFLQLNVAGMRAIGQISGAFGRFLELLSKIPGWGKFKVTADALKGVSDATNQAADDIEGNLIPNIDSAHKEWNDFGKDQRTKAALRDANQAIQNAVGKTSDALKKNGKTVDENSEKGRNNRRALKNLADKHLDYIGTLRRTDAGTKKVDKATMDARESFIKTATKITGNRKEAERLANKYGLVDTKINALNSKDINLTAKYKAQLANNTTKGFFLNVPGKTAAAFAKLKLGGPPRGQSLDSMIGAPAPPPAGMSASGGPSLVNIKHSTPNLSNLLGHPPKWQNANTSAAAKVYTDGWRTIGKVGQDWMNQALAASAMTSPTGSVGAYSAGMAGTIARLRAAGGRSFTTYPGHHPSMGKARDVTPHNWKIANTARASKGVWYVIYQMKIASKNHGNNWRQYHPSSRRGDWRHVRHVHVAWYDRGGPLRPGWTMAYNGTGRNERVMPSGGAEGGGGVINNYYLSATHYSDAQALKTALVNMDRRGDLKVLSK